MPSTSFRSPGARGPDGKTDIILVIRYTHTTSHVYCILYSNTHKTFVCFTAERKKERIIWITDNLFISRSRSRCKVKVCYVCIHIYVYMDMYLLQGLVLDFSGEDVNRNTTGDLNIVIKHRVMRRATMGNFRNGRNSEIRYSSVEMCFWDRHTLY